MLPIQPILVYDDLVAVVDNLRRSPWLVAIIATGAAGGLPGNLLPDIWGPPGASANLLEYSFAYAQESLDDALGFSPEKYCTRQTAVHIAAAAYERARALIARRRKRPGCEHFRVEDAVGVGVTSAVTTTRERRGSDQAFIAVRTIKGTFVMYANLPKAPDHAHDALAWRVQQGKIVDLLALSALLQATGVHGGLLFNSDLGIEGSTVRVFSADGNPIFGIDELSSAVTEENLFGNVFWPDGRITPLGELDMADTIVLAGSFRPLHHVHARIARLIEQATGKRVVYQISGLHPVKGPIPTEELVARARQFEHRSPVVVLARAALFVEKARVFRGADMLIGADVVYDILEPSHYEGGVSGRDAALTEMIRSGTRFHVVGRAVVGRGYQELSDIPIEGKFSGLFVPVSYREDMSSAELRS